MIPIVQGQLKLITGILTMTELMSTQNTGIEAGIYERPDLALKNGTLYPKQHRVFLWCDFGNYYRSYEHKYRRYIYEYDGVKPGDYVTGDK